MRKQYFYPSPHVSSFSDLSRLLLSEASPELLCRDFLLLYSGLASLISWITYLLSSLAAEKNLLHSNSFDFAHYYLGVRNYRADSGLGTGAGLSTSWFYFTVIDGYWRSLNNYTKGRSFPSEVVAISPEKKTPVVVFAWYSGGRLGSLFLPCADFQSTPTFLILAGQILSFFSI